MIVGEPYPIECNRLGNLKESHKLDPFESKHLVEVKFELHTFQHLFRVDLTSLMTVNDSEI